MNHNYYNFKRISNILIISISIVMLFSNLALAQSIAEWQTSMGMFRVELREDLVPITANNFISLADTNFYDTLIFHRVINSSL